MLDQNTSFQKKLMTVILLTTGVALVVSCTGFIVYELLTIHKNMARTLDSRVEFVASSLTATHAIQSQAAATEVLGALQKDPRIICACVYDASNRIYARFPANLPDTSFPATPQPPGHYFSSSSLSAFYPVFNDRKAFGTVYIRSNLSAMTERYPGYATLTVSILAGSLLAAYLLSRLLQTQISQPIESLARTAKSIANHRDYSVRATKYNNDELGFLTDTFNQMIARIQEQNQVLLQLAAIIESSDDAIIGKTLDGTVTSWNAGAEKTFGYTAAEMVGTSIFRVIPEEFQEEERRILDKIRNGLSVNRFETGRKTRDGRLINVTLTSSPIKDADGKISGISVIARDTTERKKAEDQLKASFHEITYLKAALDEHAIVAITDPAGKITYVNDKFCAISKYSREELIGQDHRMINSGHHPKEFIRELWRTISHGKVWHGEIKNRAKDNSHYWVYTTIVPFLNEDGKPIQYIAIRADITERKRAEAEVRQLNAELEKRVTERTAELEASNRELEAFSYSISHDLRAPLRSINGFSGFVLEDFSSYLPEEGRNYLERICKGSQRMGNLIDDLLAFSRLGRQPVSRQPVNMLSLAREVVDELNPHENGRHVELRIGALPACQGDPVLLKQVWVNLISNALKYSRDRDPAVIEIDCLTEKNETVYFVRDNGTGFDMQYASKLFGVFQRLHRTDEFEGTGVGLAIVQRIVQRHGGRVWAEAQPDSGAIFYFTVAGALKAV